ncbi:hypothetical protein HUJ04_004973 [Dendroctonus ponderosae]|nr:hypothetical protein HUJ04_004973 [Dendroctonus ponderosae]
MREVKLASLPVECDKPNLIHKNELSIHGYTLTSGTELIGSGSKTSSTMRMQMVLCTISAY